MQAIKSKNKAILAVLGFLALIAIFIFVAIQNTYRNPYPHGTTIDNFSTYFSNVSQKDQDKLFYHLYNHIKQDPEENTPTSGAIIREGSHYLNGNYSVFIVDIESVKSSFQVQFYFNKSIEDEDDIIFSCLSEDEKIYPEDSCSIIFISEDSTNYWVHSYLINYNMASVSSTVLNIADSFMNSRTETSTAPKIAGVEGFLTVTIDERSFKTSRLGDDSINNFSVSTNDGRSYSFIIRTHLTDDNTYLAIYINRTDIDGHTAAYILANSQTDIDTLTNWVSSYNSNITPVIKNL